MQQQYRIDHRIVSEQEAKDEGVYSIYWLDANGHTQRIDMHDGEQLYKVIYTHQTPPFDSIIQQHRNQHPGVDFECWSPPESKADGQQFHAALFDGRGRPLSKALRLEDDQGRLQWEIEYNNDGQFITHTRYQYAGDRLTKVQELDIDGNQISEMELQ